MSMLRVPEAAEALAVKEATVRAWISQGKLGHVKLGRSVRILESEISRVITENTHSHVVPRRKSR